MSLRLESHAALITGSTHGVGAAIATAMQAAGACVVRHGLDAAGVAGPCIAADLATQPIDAARALWAETLTLEPELDILVCNAGTFVDVAFLDMDAARFEKTFNLNVTSTYFLCQAAARHWVAQQTAGRIILIGSINGILAEPDHSAYDASKGAIEMLVKSLCVSLAPHGIRVNGLAPGLFETPLTAPALADPAARRWMEQHTPNGRVPDASACGEAAVFLASDAAHHVHGHMLRIDGGMSAWQQPDPG